MEPPPAVISGGEWIQQLDGNPFHTEKSLTGVGHVPKALEGHPLVINNEEGCNVIRL